MSPQKSIALILLNLVVSWSAVASPVRVDTSAYGSLDPLTGEYWQRVSDPRHPASPPRLLRVREDEAPAAKPLCVHAGDRVLVVGGSSDSSLQLQAVVLGAGAVGDAVRARVALTGAEVTMKIVDASSGVLLGPGRSQP